MSKISNILMMIELLGTGRKYSVLELARELEVTPRMVRVYKDEIEKAGIYKEEEIDEHSSLWKGHATQEFIEFIDNTVNKIKNGQDTSNIYWLQEEK